MKDLDFDELDKAVNSLMATTGSDEPVATPDSPPAASSTDSATVPVTVTTSTPASVAPAAPIPAPEPSVPVAVETPPAAPQSAPVMPAARRGGRFMDMVNSSSPKPAPAAPPSRQGISITPRPEAAEPTPVASEPTPTPLAEPRPAAPAVMPDPIDMANEAANETTPTDEPAPTAPVEPPAVTAEPEPETASSLGSPFIADAKVEKRPLNAEATLSDQPLESILNDDPEPTDEPETTESSEPTDDSAPAEPKDADEPPITPQVPELNSDLVAIEAGEKVDETEVTQAVETDDAAKEVAEPVVPLGAASIAQQYTAKESSGDKSHAAIYDASQYPEPVAHPAKKKTGWLWIVWVILLLGVGAGGAVVLYNLGII